MTLKMHVWTKEKESTSGIGRYYKYGKYVYLFLIILLNFINSKHLHLKYNNTSKGKKQ